MNSESLATITYLPTEEDTRRLSEREKLLDTDIRFLKDRVRRVAVFTEAFAAQILSWFFFWWLRGTMYAELSLLFVTGLIFFLHTIVNFYVPFVTKPKRKTAFSAARGKAASQNIFLYGDHIEIQSVNEQMQYPWTLLTGWQADETGFLLSFGQHNARFIPARALNEEKSAMLREILQGQKASTGKAEK